MNKTLILSELLSNYLIHSATELEDHSKDAESLEKALQGLVKECIPDKKSKPDEDANRWAEGVHHGYNKAIQDISKALRERGLL